MAKRMTIKNDPLRDINLTEHPEQPGDEAHKSPALDSDSDRSEAALTKRKNVGPLPGDSQTSGSKQEAHLATGGRLELLGGSFGTGVTSIRRFDGHIGFISPSSERINLESQVEAVTSSPDREEHRFLSVAGWACAGGIFLGPLGIALAGGLRLLHPKRMVLNMRLHDGRMLVVRTDSVTCAALRRLPGLAAHRGSQFSAP